MMRISSDFDSLLWLFLATVACLQGPTYWSGLWMLCGALVECLFPEKKAVSERFWRPPSQGVTMSIVLVPILALGIARATNDPRWNLYVQLLSLQLIANRNFGPIQWLVIMAFILGTTSLRLLDQWHQPRMWVLISTRIILQSSIHFFPSFQKKVWTKGEWTIVTSLAAIATTEWFLGMRQDTNYDHSTIHHSRVAIAGVLGCTMSCLLSSTFFSKSSWKLFGCIAGPLLFVEATMPRLPGTLVPQSLSWLFSFLSIQEGVLFPQRGLWLLYWAIILLLALVFAPQCQQDTLTTTKTTSVVVARKWFHLMAILLFIPPTWDAPQLMSLSYAIALCVLMVFECLKSDLPVPMQDFYGRYLDHSKDHPQALVISHMALIVGCAMPLWIYVCCSTPTWNTHSPTNYPQQLLPFWGIIVLGVGDSMAALVGTYYGRTKWCKESQRTIEGSVAMWISMALICQWFEQPWILAVTFVTLLEAFTMQIDNLVLPLAGATVLLLTQ